jgi:hypothetical protein
LDWQKSIKVFATLTTRIKSHKPGRYRDNADCPTCLNAGHNDPGKSPFYARFTEWQRESGDLFQIVPAATNRPMTN